MLKENKPILEECNIDKWREKGYTGKNVNVLVLDSNGKMLDHMKPYTTVIDPDKVIKDEYKHNTSVAQVIHEYAIDAHIYVIPWSHTSKEKSVKWIQDNAKLIDIINISMVTNTEEQFDFLKDLNIPTICGSGNDYEQDKKDGVRYPAAFDWSIAVGSFRWSYKGANARSIPSYSNGGIELDVVAPTEVTVLNEYGKTITFDGTSCATPSLTGMLCLYIQWRKDSNLPKLTIAECQKFVKDNSHDIEDIGFDFESGYGLFKLPVDVPKVEPPKVAPTPAMVAKAKSDTILIYEVRPKNSVSGISKKYGVSKANIMKWNSLNADKLTAGQYLFLEDPAKIIKILEQTPL